jgi:uncharacterized protein
MTAPLHMALSQVAPQPWRNGGGVTRELLVWPSTAESPDWQLRLSVADIERDGPFSAFPGVQRSFCVLQGQGVELDFAGQLTPCHVGDAPLVFDGAAAPGCRLLGGPTRDLNLMLRGVQGGLLPVQAGQPWRPNAGVCGLFTAVAGLCHSEGERAWALKPHCLLWFGKTSQALRFEPSLPTTATLGWWVHAVAPEQAARIPL